jgi:TPR repeat protein
MVRLSVPSQLRIDPEVAAEMPAAAEKHAVDVRYGMELIYAEGRGVAPDEVESYYRTGRAIEQGAS